MSLINRIPLLLLLLALLSCKGNTGNQATDTTDSHASRTIPTFNADSAYAYIAAQVAFGTRVPGTPTHAACADYLASEMTRHGAQVIRQQARVTAYDGTVLPITNIIASFNPEAQTRILLCAHWDTRPWADHDPNAANHHTPILGANDGASGVGVLLEIARLIGRDTLSIGIDLILFDAEDYGTPHWESEEVRLREDNDLTWCLGSQYWAANPHKPNYTARYGILLDMVGAENTIFCKEGFSMEYAAPIVEKVWSAAAANGYSHLFRNQLGGYVTDDHLPVNRRAGIPCINIIGSDPTGRGFHSVWHTVKDDMTCIDPTILQAVGHTLLTVLYNEPQ